MDFLDTIIAHKQKEVEILKIDYPISQNNNDYEKYEKFFLNNLKKSGISIIAEVKRRSPSAGILKENFVPGSIAEEYQNSSVDAISVLTDKKFFGGDLKDLSSIKNKVEVPILRKDFIIDPYQLYESRTMGADCILLITRILGKRMLKDFITITRKLGMSSLVEVHTEEEIEWSLECDAEIIGINNRDLNTFTVDIQKSLQLGSLIPDHIVKISESGIHTVSQVKRLYKAGFDGVLIGEALMRSSEPGRLIKRWKQSCTSEDNNSDTITKSYIL